MNFFTNLWGRFVNTFPDLLIAVLYLIIAFVVALLAKKVIMSILRKVGADKWLAKAGVEDEKTGSSTEFIGKLVFLIIFLLFLPAVLTQLGMNNVAMPITSAVSVVVNFLPNLLAAGIILLIGIYVAKIITQLVKALLNKVGLDKLQKRIGIEVEDEKDTFSKVISGIVYILILVPVIIATLQVLGIESIAIPATTILSQVFGYFPRLFFGVILLIIGFQISKILTPVVESALASIGTNKLTEKISLDDRNSPKFSLSKVISEILRWLILVVFFIEAVNLLRLDIFTAIGQAVLGYLPFVLSAIIIIGGGILIAAWIERLILKHSPKQKTLALITKVVIVVFAAFMTLSQLGFAQDIVNVAFIIILAAVAVAFAISFGIGGRTFASNALSKLEKKLEETNEIDDKNDVSQENNNK